MVCALQAQPTSAAIAAAAAREGQRTMIVSSGGCARSAQNISARRITLQGTQDSGCRIPARILAIPEAWGTFGVTAGERMARAALGLILGFGALGCPCAKAQWTAIRLDTGTFAGSRCDAAT